MTTLRFLRDDLARAYDGDAWHGDPLLTLLDGIDHEAAAAHPIPGAHSVWEIVLHLTAWTEIGLERLLALDAPPVDDDRDWPAVPAVLDAPQWSDALERLGAAHRALLTAVDALDDGDAGRPLGPRDRSQGSGGTVAYLLAGIAQHAAYHGGQIALLRKALG